MPDPRPALSLTERALLRLEERNAAELAAGGDVVLRCGLYYKLTARLYREAARRGR